MSTVNKIENYLDAIKAQSGVVYLTGAPGIGKTAILEDISTKQNWKYFDIRLSQCSEEDIAIPQLVDGVIKTCIPEWADDANNQPSLIVFEELNRASLAVRNAALQILLERRIGHKFKFNKNVFFVATGNLGEEDGCDVEEFDDALNNRLIHYKFTTSVSEWVEGYAKANVHPFVVDFVETKPEYFYKKGDSAAYATPRSWTHLSNLIISKFGKDVSKVNEIKQLVSFHGPAYVGASSVAFIQFLSNLELVSIQDVIDDYDKVKKSLKNINRDIKSSLLNNLKTYDFDKLNQDQFKNVVSFLKNDLSEDETVSFIVHVVESKDLNDKKSNSIKLLKEFNAIKEKIISLL